MAIRRVPALRTLWGVSDAIVIGAGPNGLVAANLLVDEGWDVVVLEAQPEPGGAVKSADLIEPGFTNDVFSAFYPLAAASPIIRSLELHRHGLRWARSPLALAHPLPDGSCASLSMDLDETANSLDQFARGDGDAWRRLYQLWQRLADDLIEALFVPFPPVVATARIAASLHRDLVRFARFAMLPVRRLAEEHFRGDGAALLFAGNALHTDLAPESIGSGLFGWLLCSLGQQYGFPVPEGGAGRLIDALVARLQARGGTVRCNAPVRRVLIRAARAAGVELQDGTEIPARRAVLADVGAPALYLDLVGTDHLPSHIVNDVARFQYDNSTVKVDWTLNGPVPWKADDARRAGTVHLAEDLNHLTTYSAQLAMSAIPQRPFLVFGQMNVVDPSRSPARTETAWAYTHVPQRARWDAGGELTGSWTESEAESFADRMESEVEALAPGFRALIRGRHILHPGSMEAADANLVGGAVNGGTAQLYQQLIFRPTPGFGRPETPIRGLYLASASAHPGGGVHGAPGSNAAVSALGRERRKRRVIALGGALAGYAAVRSINKS